MLYRAPRPEGYSLCDLQNFDAVIQSGKTRKEGDDEDGSESDSKSKAALRENGDNGDDDHLCPCCGYSFVGKWRWFYGRYGMCPACGSLERHRLTCAYIGLKPEALGFCRPPELADRNLKILQIAPDPVGDALSRLPRVSVTRFDREMPQAEVHGDITNMP